MTGFLFGLLLGFYIATGIVVNVFPEFKDRIIQQDAEEDFWWKVFSWPVQLLNK